MQEISPHEHKYNVFATNVSSLKSFAAGRIDQIFKKRFSQYRHASTNRDWVNKVKLISILKIEFNKVHSEVTYSLLEG